MGGWCGLFEINSNSALKLELKLELAGAELGNSPQFKSRLFKMTGGIFSYQYKYELIKKKILEYVQCLVPCTYSEKQYLSVDNFVAQKAAS